VVSWNSRGRDVISLHLAGNIEANYPKSIRRLVIHSAPNPRQPRVDHISPLMTIRHVRLKWITADGIGRPERAHRQMEVEPIWSVIQSGTDCFAGDCGSVGQSRQPLKMTDLQQLGRDGESLLPTWLYVSIEIRPVEVRISPNRSKRGKQPIVRPAPQFNSEFVIGATLVMEPKRPLRLKRPSKLVTENSFHDQIGAEKGGAAFKLAR
jgi:hypothetical protein